MSGLSPDDGDWIDQVVDRFDACFQAGERPKIADYLGGATGTRRLGLLLQLIQVEWEHRWQNREQLHTEHYLTDWPELKAHERCLYVLLRCECEFRKKQGKLPKLEELVHRFPQVDPSDLRSRVLAQLETVSSDGSSPASGTVPSQIGPYKVLRRLGEGGFGAVYLGHDEDLDIPLAIKVPSARLLATTRAREEFLREVRIVARLRHDAIVRTY
ncbi:MAG: hypothetical protein HY000_16070, partial [Planctomycetes bacterium]|nr:hypothetical protein [Planctomycetota bacterium]